MDHATDTAPANVEKAAPPAEHTPGPWQVSLVDETEVQSADRDLVASTFLSHADYERKYAERAANARLIAAAPDLLEAAELALATAESWIHDQLDGTSGLEAELEKLEPVHAAIAKARGIPPDP